MRFFAAIQSGNHPPLSGTNGLEKARERVEILAKSVATAWGRIQQLTSKMGDSYQAVFVAPEFYFVNNQAASAPDRYLSHDDKRWTVAQLAAIAKSFPKLLIIPGTVLWTKAVNESNTGKTKERIVKAYEQHKSALPKLQEKHGAQYGNNVESIVSNQSGQKHFAYSGSAKIPAQTYPPYYLLDSVPDTVIAQNVAYVCKGDTILKYAKVGNSHELGGNQSNAVFSPGSLAGLFSVGDVRYGLEICMDHWVGVLQHGTGALSAPHIQIITSSYTENRSFHFKVADNGLILHSSTEGSIEPYETTGIPDAPPTEEALTNGLKLFSFQLGIAADGKATDALTSQGDNQGIGIEGALPKVKKTHSDLAENWFG
ncbi:MAG TPA: hypothetical protein VG675_14055 [Bryobacteraceae bacterium]|nr:hypothetical protein [Bryobacteraceae bacterium]